MRPQLLVGGLFTALLGALLYFIGLFAAMGVVFIAGGAVMGAAGLVASEGGLHVSPPEGHSFCVFCSTPVPLEAERCPRCNGLQPKEGR
jgi:hypothetical protein